MSTHEDGTTEEWGAVADEHELSDRRCVFSSRRRHTIFHGDWSSDVCSSDLHVIDTKLVEKVSAEASLTRRPSEAAREIISTSLYPDSPEGSTPDAVAVSP